MQRDSGKRKWGRDQGIVFFHQVLGVAPTPVPPLLGNEACGEFRATAPERAGGCCSVIEAQAGGPALIDGSNKSRRSVRRVMTLEPLPRRLQALAFRRHAQCEKGQNSVRGGG